MLMNRTIIYGIDEGIENEVKYDVTCKGKSPGRISTEAVQRQGTSTKF